MDGNERIQWALDFANADLTMASAADWERLVNDVDEFLSIGKATAGIGDSEFGGIVFAHPDPRQEITSSSLKELQGQVQRLLSVFRLRQEVAKTGGYKAFLDEIEVDVGGAWSIGLWPSLPDDFHLRFRSGDWKNGFLLILMNLIKNKDTARIRECPICRTLFARIGRQEYCSRRCGNIASKRAYRARKK